MSILKEIYNYKLNYVKQKKALFSQNEIESKIKVEDNNSKKFYNKLKNNSSRLSIIGEIKKASPSLGEFVKSDTDLVKIAKIYENNKISCLSILTDEKYFKGSTEDLINIKKETSIPILRKDFIVDEYQIYESKLIGADCVLIILSMLDSDQAENFCKIAIDLDLDTIIEIHNKDEFQLASRMSSNMIGINNRNLNNFVTDIKTTINISKNIINNDKLLISESGFRSRLDIDKILNTTGINNFLIGEYLMKSNNLSTLIRELLN